jgi:hypothetical protein
MVKANAKVWPLRVHGTRNRLTPWVRTKSSTPPPRFSQAKRVFVGTRVPLKERHRGSGRKLKVPGRDPCRRTPAQVKRGHRFPVKVRPEAMIVVCENVSCTAIE